jgi:hypothetical protein
VARAPCFVEPGRDRAVRCAVFAGRQRATMNGPVAPAQQQQPRRARRRRGLLDQPARPVGRPGGARRRGALPLRSLASLALRTRHGLLVLRRHRPAPSNEGRAAVYRRPRRRRDRSRRCGAARFARRMLRQRHVSICTAERRADVHGDVAATHGTGPVPTIRVSPIGDPPHALAQWPAARAPGCRQLPRAIAARLSAGRLPRSAAAASSSAANEARHASRATAEAGRARSSS